MLAAAAAAAALVAPSAAVDVAAVAAAAARGAAFEGRAGRRRGVEGEGSSWGSRVRIRGLFLLSRRAAPFSVFCKAARFRKAAWECQRVNNIYIRTLPASAQNRKWIMRFMEINEMPWRSREHPNDFITGLDVAITLQERPGSSPGDQMSTNGDSSGAPRRAGWSWRQLGASEALRGTKWPFHHSKRVVPTS